MPSYVSFAGAELSQVRRQALEEILGECNQRCIPTTEQAELSSLSAQQFESLFEPFWSLTERDIFPYRPAFHALYSFLRQELPSPACLSAKDLPQCINDDPIIKSIRTLMRLPTPYSSLADSFVHRFLNTYAGLTGPTYPPFWATIGVLDFGPQELEDARQWLQVDRTTDLEVLSLELDPRVAVFSSARAIGSARSPSSCQNFIYLICALYHGSEYESRSPDPDGSGAVTQYCKEVLGLTNKLMVSRVRSAITIGRKLLWLQNGRDSAIALVFFDAIRRLDCLTEFQIKEIGFLLDMHYFHDVIDLGREVQDKYVRYCDTFRRVVASQGN